MPKITTVEIRKASIYQVCLCTLHNTALDFLSATVLGSGGEILVRTFPSSPDPSLCSSQFDRTAEYEP